MHVFVSVCVFMYTYVCTYMWVHTHMEARVQPSKLLVLSSHLLFFMRQELSLGLGSSLIKLSWLARKAWRPDLSLPPSARMCINMYHHTCFTWMVRIGLRSFCLVVQWLSHFLNCKWSYVFHRHTHILSYTHMYATHAWKTFATEGCNSRE